MEQGEEVKDGLFVDTSEPQTFTWIVTVQLFLLLGVAFSAGRQRLCVSRISRLPLTMRRLGDPVVPLLPPPGHERARPPNRGGELRLEGRSAGAPSERSLEVSGGPPTITNPPHRSPSTAVSSLPP